jgi:hypothetical protein
MRRGCSQGWREAERQPPASKINNSRDRVGDSGATARLAVPLDMALCRITASRAPTRLTRTAYDDRRRSLVNRNRTHPTLAPVLDGTGPASRISSSTPPFRCVWRSFEMMGAGGHGATIQRVATENPEMHRKARSMLITRCMSYAHFADRVRLDDSLCSDSLFSVTSATICGQRTLWRADVVRKSSSGTAPKGSML